MIHYTQIIWEEVAFIWKVTGKAVAIFMTGTVAIYTPPSFTLATANKSHDNHMTSSETQKERDHK